LGGEIFRTCPDRPWGTPSLLYSWYRVFPGGKERPGRDADPSPLSSAVIKRVELYLFSSYGPYGLYRASVPVQRYTLPLPIPLLPLWTVQPVQSLSACTTVHFTFTSTPPMDRMACTDSQCLCNGALYLYLYLYSPYGPYRLYRVSVPVQRCTLPLPIPLLPLRTVQPVQSLSACTTVYFTFTYTSSPPMDRTACTETQCLYNGALYLYLYLYSPYGLYGLYRVKVPVQRCTLPLPIPLLPLWAVRPVQSFSASTTVHFTFTYTYTPLRSVRPVQSFSACRVETESGGTRRRPGGEVKGKRRMEWVASRLQLDSEQSIQCYYNCSPPTHTPRKPVLD